MRFVWLGDAGILRLSLNGKDRMRLKVRVSGGNRWAIPVPGDLPLTFEGKRAFIVWDSVTLGDFELQARIELNPRLLKKIRGTRSEYTYRGKLILPRPQDN